MSSVAWQKILVDDWRRQGNLFAAGKKRYDSLVRPIAPMKHCPNRSIHDRTGQPDLAGPTPPPSARPPDRRGSTWAVSARHRHVFFIDLAGSRVAEFSDTAWFLGMIWGICIAEANPIAAWAGPRRAGTSFVRSPRPSCSPRRCGMPWRGEHGSAPDDAVLLVRQRRLPRWRSGSSPFGLPGGALAGDFCMGRRARPIAAWALAVRAPPPPAGDVPGGRPHSLRSARCSGRDRPVTLMATCWHSSS